ncbi:MAG: ribosome maturation factor [Saprospiraceae bacterium]|nr:ribosome maturation factor [Saprospiraceae bacterium]
MEINEISTWVEQFLEQRDDDYFLVDIYWNKKSQKLEIFIDTDEGVTLGECQQISRQMQSEFDEQAILSDDYVLDVSSPGIDRPLKLRRQYKKNLGRVLSVEQTDGTSEIGRLENINGEGIFLSPENKGIKGRKTTYGQEKLILWENIKETIVQIRF